MVRVSVFVASWEIECCWPPPAVGDSRDWVLSLVVGEAAVDGVRVWDGVVEPLGAAESGEGLEPAVLHLEEFDVFWRDCGGRRGPTQVSGRLFHDFHSSVSTIVTPSVGTVRGVRVEDRGFVLGSDPAMGSAWYPTDEPAGYRPVDVSPKWFKRLGTDDATPLRDETGVLADVEITTGGGRVSIDSARGPR